MNKKIIEFLNYYAEGTESEIPILFSIDAQKEHGMVDMQENCSILELRAIHFPTSYLSVIKILAILAPIVEMEKLWEFDDEYVEIFGNGSNRNVIQLLEHHYNTNLHKFADFTDAKLRMITLTYLKLALMKGVPYEGLYIVFTNLYSGAALQTPLNFLMMLTNFGVSHNPISALDAFGIMDKNDALSADKTDATLREVSKSNCDEVRRITKYLLINSPLITKEMIKNNKLILNKFIEKYA